MKKLFYFLILSISLFSKDFSKEEIEKLIGNMIILGFEGESVPKSLQKDIKKYHLGGVVLFGKNIKNPKQLKKLTFDLKKEAKYPLLICVDEEGGSVERLKGEGFIRTPSADRVAKKGDLSYAKRVYFKLAKELKKEGFNCNFAPVLDLALNSKNLVIVKKGRSYGSDPKEVVKYAEIFIKELKSNQILPVLKHFPGHGSSFGDTHKGFTDISSTWRKKELLPYKRLIDENLADAVMVAHVFNDRLDSKYPATLSYRVATKLLREGLGFEGIVISDDMQMGAISKNYSLKDSVTLAINAGVDVLLFANQTKKRVKAKDIVEIVYKQIKNGKIDLKTILRANERIKRVKKSLK